MNSVKLIILRKRTKKIIFLFFSVPYKHTRTCVIILTRFFTETTEMFIVCGMITIENVRIYGLFLFLPLGATARRELWPPE
jgi:hypothetical protein